jgi:arylsulfatase A-like enzyme
MLYGSAGIGNAQTNSNEGKPNVILFLVDDLGWNDTSLPLSGEKTKYNKRYDTPNLEKLARQGITFTNAHSQALCVPSRASLMSGQNSIHNGVVGDYKPTLDKYRNLEIPPGTVLDVRYALPQLLKKNGYKTIHCGKYHLAEYDGGRPTPEDIGFDVNIAGSIIGGPPSYYGSDDFANKKKTKSVKGLEAYHGKDIHLTKALTIEAISEMEKAVNADEPFFLYMAHYAVHTPIMEHKPYMDHVQLEAFEKDAEAKYASMIKGVDVSLGQLMAKVKSLNIDDNTLIIFYSDNGGRVLWRGNQTLYGDYQFNYPLRSGKASIYEGGLRVPAVISWPGRIAAGRQSDAPVIIEDLYPTVINATQTAVPQYYNVDGMDLIQLAKAKKTPASFKNRSLYFYLPYRFEGAVFNGEDFADGGVTPSSAIIKDNWKLIYLHGDKKFELYNLTNDIGETSNVVNDYPKRAENLVLELDAYMRGYNAVHPLLLPERKPLPWPMEAWKSLKIE